ncbi:MAG TPA: YqgE/AlgH family protein, partial [Candidatus Binatus sp.]|nr:YqgE/AlgH family protein [Candidatus Binatus sp.]
RGPGSIGHMASTGSFAPTLLLAMPQMADRNFARSVVLLCEHGADGAIGFIVNRPTDLRAAAAVVLDPPVSRDNGLVFWSGGPVEPERGFLLLGESPGAVDSQCVAEGLYLTASVEVLRGILESDPQEVARRRCRLLLGYAGWGPGQLDQELTASAWLSAPAEADLVFNTAPEVMWDRAIRSLGVDPMALQLGPGVQ